MTKVELPASVINTITLEGDGKRRTIEDSAGLRKLIWDAENILAEMAKPATAGRHPGLEGLGADSGGTAQAVSCQ